MSISLMTIVWRLDLHASLKIVLLALADNANDDGGCWPSVATIARKCSKSERTIQGALAELRATGHLSWEDRPGKGRLYTVHPHTPAETAPPQKLHPRRNFTPAEAAPPQNLRDTPAESAPKPSRTTSISTVASQPPIPRAKSAVDWPCPDGVDPAHWSDLLANRKTRRLTNTATALKGVLAALEKLADDEWPPGRLVQLAAERGWGFIFHPKEPSRGNSHRNAERAERGYRDPIIGDALERHLADMDSAGRSGRG